MSPRWAGVVAILFVLAGLSCGETTDPLSSVPTQLAFGTQPSDELAGSPIAPAVRVNILDADGLLVVDATTTVTLELGSNPGAATLSGTTSVKAVGGQATFSDLWIDKAASGYTLVARARVQSGEGTATSSTFAISPGAAAELVFTVEPSNVMAGEVITPPIEVTALDAFGNVVAAPAMDVTVQLAGGAAPSSHVLPSAGDSAGTPANGAMPSPAAPTTLNGTTTVRTVDGVAIFDDLRIDEAATDYTLAASSGGLNSDPSTSFATAPAAPANIGFKTQPIDGTAKQPIPPFEVAIVDAFGNVATTAAGVITVAFGANPGGSALSGTTTQSAVNGVATFDDLSLDKAASGYTLTASASGFGAQTSQAFGISAPQLQFITPPTSAAAGAAIDPPIRVGIYDHLQALITSATDPVTLSIDSNPGGGTISGTTTVNAVGGIATFDSVAIDMAGIGYTLAASGTDLSGVTSDSLDISSALATRFVIVNPPDGTVDAPILVTVQALDQFGNVVPSETRDVTLRTSGSATGGGRVDIENGIGTRLISNVVAETVTLTLLDTEGTGLNVSSTQDVVFGPSLVARYVIIDPPSGTVDAPITVTVEAQDAFGNVVPTENRDVTLNASGSATGSGLVDIVDGVGTRALSDQLAETVTLTLVDTEGTGLNVSSIKDLVFGSGAATRYVILDPSNGTVGTPIPVTVRALDQYNNVATGENRDVTLLTSGSATGGGAVNITSGSGTRLISDQVPETVLLSLVDSDGTGLIVSSTQDVVFGPVGATRFVIIDPTDGSVDASITVTVEAQDAFGNVVTSESRDVTLNASGSATGFGLVDIVNGVGTRALSDQVPETVTLTLTDTQGTGLNVSSSEDVVFAPGAATRYVIEDPADGAVGTLLPVTVRALDQFGNVATGENRNVTLLTSGSATGGGVVNVTNGIGTRLISDQVPETVTLSLVDSDGTGLNVSSTQDVVFALVGATRYVIIDPPNATVDAPVAVTVQAQDVFGNVVPTENRDVTINASGSATGTGLVDVVNGVGTRLISDQVPETVTLTLTDTQGTGLDVSSTEAVVFAPGEATRYVIRDPADGPVGNPILVTVEALDQFGNRAAGENRDVSLLTSGSATGGGVVGISNGIGTRLINDQVPETVTLSLTDTQGTGLDVSSVQDVVFGALAATRYVIVDPLNGTVDGPVTVTVQAQDAFGNVVTSESRDVTLNASGSATGAGLVDIVNGVGTRTLSDQVAETVTLTLSDTQGTGLDVSSTQDVVFSAGVATRYVIRDPTDGSVGTAILVTVEALDQFGNRATGESRDVTLLTSGSATGGGNVSISNGLGTRLINDQVPETVTLSLTDTQGTGLDVSSVQNVVFGPVGATRYVILDPPNGTVDGPVTVTVQAQDAFGNVVTSETRDVTLNASGSAAGGGLVDIVNGVGTRTLSDQVPETVTLTLTDTQGTGLEVSSTQDVVFGPGIATRYVILDPPDGPVGTQILVTVEALDQFGNRATGESRDVTLLTSGSATGGGNVNINNGIGTRLINDLVPETVTLTLADTQGTGLNVTSTQDVVFAPSLVTRYAIIDPPNGSVDGAVTVTVEAQDQFGNVVPSEIRDVTLNASGSATGAGLVNIVNGVGTRTLSDQVAETVTLTLTDTEGTGLNVSSTQDVVFAPGAATRFVIDDPTDGLVGSPILVTVRALDQYANVATGENRDVTLLTTGSATGGGVTNIASGVGTRLIGDEVPETVTLSLADTEGTGLNV
ncbi:MAG: hypothetical protein OER90_05165, partial [Gemmatimonadota bacterium]|nr:hypothetical protein [Gemmatimonadota bacterium]